MSKRAWAILLTVIFVLIAVPSIVYLSLDKSGQFRLKPSIDHACSGAYSVVLSNLGGGAKKGGAKQFRGGCEPKFAAVANRISNSLKKS